MNAVPVPDTTPPVITLLGSAVVNINVGDIYTDAGATASDDVDGDITANIVTVNPVNTAVAGTYIVTYNVSDAASNAATEVTRTVNVNAVPVPDTTPPVITLLGSSVENLAVGDTFNDAGATAFDDTDGDITNRIVTYNPVNTSVPGSYTVTYNVSDSAGNPAVEVSRPVNVSEAPAQPSPQQSAYIEGSQTFVDNSITGFSSPESPNGNGTSRGSGAGMFSAIARFSAMWRGIGATAPGAFGGTINTPLSTNEIEYICSVQRGMKKNSKPGLQSYVAQQMANMMGRDEDFIEEKLTNTSFCESTNMSIRPKKRAVKEVVLEFPVDDEGYPISSNPVWNACVRNEGITLALIKSNTDRDDPRDGGTPKTCADYHTQSVWRHPDLNMYFSFMRPYKQIILPKGYAILNNIKVALGG